jgi:hypothetical protein
MGIESKHAYRFGFLRSEEWRGIRLEVLSKYGGRCFVCKKEDWSNDVHHLLYSKDWKKTPRKHMVPLCRVHHDRFHDILRKRPGLNARIILDQMIKEIDPNRIDKYRFMTACKKAAKEIRKYLLTGSETCTTCPTSG